MTIEDKIRALFADVTPEQWSEADMPPSDLDLPKAWAMIQALRALLGPVAQYDSVAPCVECAASHVLFPDLRKELLARAAAIREALS